MTSETASPSITELLARDHRRLDDLFGRLLAAMSETGAAGATDFVETGAAPDAIRRFDAALRRHTALEEEHLFPAPPGKKLAATPDESPHERLFRELRLEHVQVRELSAMIVHLLSGGGAPDRARGLAASLARRWDAHTTREEGEAYPLLSELLDPAGEAAIRDALSRF
ncbi:MAG TPA: hemerythrin domain-containing protein [Thermoanaerobaculia bacterium]